MKIQSVGCLEPPRPVRMARSHPRPEPKDTVELSLVQKVMQSARRWAAVSMTLLGLTAAAAIGGPLGVVTITGQETESELLDKVQYTAFRYFWDNADPQTGMVLDRAHNRRHPDLTYSPSSVAATGFGLSAILVARDRGWVAEDQARERIRNTLHFMLHEMPEHHGFFYHFVDPKTGERQWNCELSSIDTALFLAGALSAAQAYPDSDISRMANTLYERVDWPWMMNGGETLTMGWTPENGFIPSRWDHYDESSMLYILAMGSPTHPIPSSAWDAVRRPKARYGEYEFMACPPLFTHQYSHLWVDFRNKVDRGGNDFFNSSIQATLANRQFCIDQKEKHKTYSENSWGLTASDGPDGYRAYGGPPDQTNHDGTIAPTGAIGSYQFTPRESYQALRHMAVERKNRLWGRYGLADAYNDDRHWVAKDVLGIDQGAIILSIENHRSGSVWRNFMSHPAVQKGMQAAGFH